MGAFFNYPLSRGRRQELQHLLLPFHKDEKVSAKYAAWVLGQVLVAGASLALNHSHLPLGAQVLAVVAMPLWYTFHRFSGFARLEHLAEGGPQDVPDQVVQRFVRLNLPVHSGYALVYLLTAAWLVAGLA
ncbi:hypothetical protein [Actinomyces weissii]|uniref:hypothetical protein n=1 Tax=Actinomyces weissii TaxID=675090 RepID=UPI001F35B477|nr:hypothetical protein [Actinomyces weissii]